MTHAPIPGYRYPIQINRYCRYRRIERYRWSNAIEPYATLRIYSNSSISTNTKTIGFEKYCRKRHLGAKPRERYTVFSPLLIHTSRKNRFKLMPQFTRNELFKSYGSHHYSRVYVKPLLRSSLSICGFINNL